MGHSTNARWWTEPTGEVHDAVTAVFSTVRDETEWLRSADSYHASLYCGSDAPIIEGRGRGGYEYGPSTLPYNVCRSAVDTLQAKVSTQRPLPQCLAQRGNWTSQKKARRMTQYLEGEFYRQRFFETHWRGWIRDALIFGRGVLKVWTDEDRVTTERIHPWEVYADEWDARHGDPRNLYHCRSLDREVAIAMFGKRDAIESAGRFAFTESYEDFSGSTVDRVDLVECWHLPSRPGANDGRHVIICQGATLLDEGWEYDYFPFVFLGYCDPIAGYAGHAHGLVEQLEGYQYEINLASEKSSEQHRMSGMGVLVPDTAKITNQDIRNGITVINHRAGGQPSVFDMDLVNEHTRQRPRELTQDALNDAGISQMSAQSQKTPGITAAVAIQAVDDIETQRFQVFARAAESGVLEVARRYVDCAKRIAKHYGELSVSVPMKGGILELRWADVYVDGVELRMFSTSLLPQQPGARLERLTQMFNIGVVDRATLMRHLEAPDMQAEMDLETADILVVDEMLEVMMEAEGEVGDVDAEEEAYRPPDAYQRLEWAAKRAQQKLNRGTLDGMPEFNRALLRRFIKDAEQLVKRLAAEQAAPPPGAEPPMAPPPAPTPQAPELSDLGIPGTAPPAAA